jgi:tRNA A37 threonylcarbamoyladenosine dehydratase
LLRELTKQVGEPGSLIYMREISESVQSTVNSINLELRQKPAKEHRKAAKVLRAAPALGRLNSKRGAGRSRAALVGLGGGGSHVAQQLAHIGLGNFLLIDPDFIEDTNLNRLVGATLEDVKLGTAKVDIAERVIKGVNRPPRS